MLKDDVASTFNLQTFVCKSWTLLILLSYEIDMVELLANILMFAHQADTEH